MKIFGIAEEVFDEIMKLFTANANIEKAVLFGSRAMGRYKEGSDIDIALYGENLSLNDQLDLSIKLEKLGYPYVYDFQIHKNLKDKNVLDHIDRVGIIIYQKVTKDISDWKAVTLQDVVSVLGDGLHGTPSFDDTGEYYFINGNNLDNGKIVFKENTRRTNKEEYDRYKKDLNDRTILVSINGTLGNVALYNNEKCFLGKSACYFNVIDEVDKLFIRYVVTEKNFQEYISNYANGTTIKNVSLKTMREYPFLLPSLPEQIAIAGVLSSLDDKIDLLHRQNKTLETMAETLFRQWFVEEPNEDWEEYNLLEIIKLVGGGTPKTIVEEYWNGEIDWLSGGDISSNHKSFITSSEKKITEEGLNNSAAKLLPKFSTVISARGTVGKYCLLGKPMSYSQTNYGILPQIDDCYFFTYLIINYIVSELQSAAYGSVFDTITTATFKDQTIVLPVAKEIISFENSIKVYFEKMLSNTTQIRTLEKLRDTLLPKLMNGEIRLNLD